MFGPFRRHEWQKALLGCALAVALLLMSGAARAGSFKLHVTGSGAVYSAHFSKKSQNWTQPADSANSITISRVRAVDTDDDSGPAVATAQISATVTGTWVPDPKLPSDPAPLHVILQVQSSAQAEWDIDWWGAQSGPCSADDGLGQNDPQDPVTGTVSGTRYFRVDVTNGSFTYTIAPNAAGRLAFSQVDQGDTFAIAGPVTITVTDHAFLIWDAADTWSTHLDFSDGHIGSLTAAQIAAQEAKQSFRPVVGAAADNASKILLEYDSLTPDPVVFTVTTPPNAAPITYISGGPANNQGLYATYAVYSVPDVSIAFPQYGQMTKPLTFTATSASGTYHQPLTLVRPPVVLAHGIWDKGQSWVNSTGVYSLLKSAGFNVSVLDYQQTNHSSFATNLHTVWLGQGGIKSAIDAYHGKQWACSNADIIGHSMGGILTRYFASEPRYATVDNYYKGWAHRLVTIGSPHYGSPQSELYWWLYLSTRDYPDGVAWIFLLTYPFLGPTSTPALPGLALRDLTPGSVALASIHNPTACKLPVFAEIGNANPYGDIPAFAEERGVMKHDLYIKLTTGGGVVFVDGNATDTTVSDISQQGGLAAPYFATVTNGIDHIPLPGLPLTSEMRSTAIGQDIIAQLYNDNFNFAGFPNSVPDPNDGLNLPTLTDPYASQVYDPDGLPFTPPILGSATIAIAAPPAGQTVSPGSSVTVTFTPNTGTTIASATVNATDSNGGLIATSTVTAAPFTATITIPQTTVGNVNITAAAVDTAGTPSVANTSISAQTTATVQSLTVNQLIQPIFTGIGQSEQLQVMAAYSDGVSRDVTTSGTTYVSASPAVATMSSTGLVTAVGTGSTYITVTNGGAGSSFAVVVNPQAPTILATMPLGAGAGQTFSLQLDGANFGGATGIQFLTPTGTPDPNVTVSGMSLSPDSHHLTATVTIAANCPSEQDTVVVTAAGGSSQATPVDGANVFTVLPASNSLSLSSATATGVQTLQGTLLLNAPVSASGTMTLTSSDPSVTVPASITVYPGEISETFPITTSQVTTQTPVTITATYGGVSTTATLTESP